MGIINLLDAQVANLIAAGEVVERPASAVKELLENSIDAGADKITLEIKNGGVSLIRITDNGCGMSKDDALVCTKRHATSKIKDAADLDGISTLGFRGEALAAISSVSSMRIMTRTKDSDAGYMIECRAGDVTSVEEVGCPIGTTIIVEELFANVPARKKFLKRDASETAAVAAVAEKIALSRPDISIKFITDGNLRFQTAGDGNLMNVIYAVLGRDFAKKMTKVYDMTDGVEVVGFIGTPENSRGNRNSQNFFINGRYVKCKTATAALEQAFSSYIPHERFPSCVINIIINPAFVDVNVHPQKMEVKFSNEKPIFNAVYCAVRNALMQDVSRPTIDPSQGTRYSGDSFKLFNDVIGMKTQTDEEARKIADDKDVLSLKYEQITVAKDVKDTPLVEVSEGESGDDSELIFKPLFADEERIKKDKQEKSSPDPYVTPFKEPEGFTVGIGGLTGDSGDRDIGEKTGNTDTAYEKTKTLPLPWYKIVGVVFNTYIFVELDDRMLIIDKHAAHERIIFENMRDNLKAASPVAQLVVIPIEVSLTNEEAAASLEYKTELSAVGFEFEIAENGKTALVVQYPSGLTVEQAREMFSSIASSVSAGEGTVEISREQIYERALYQASCKAAVKGGREDSPENIAWITEKVLTNPRVRYCPHGRPVAFEMTKSQFEKRFERI